MSSNGNESPAKSPGLQEQVMDDDDEAGVLTQEPLTPATQKDRRSSARNAKKDGQLEVMKEKLKKNELEKRDLKKALKQDTAERTDMERKLAEMEDKLTETEDKLQENIVISEEMDTRLTEMKAEKHQLMAELELSQEKLAEELNLKIDLISQLDSADGSNVDSAEPMKFLLMLDDSKRQLVDRLSKGGIDWSYNRVDSTKAMLDFLSNPINVSGYDKVVLFVGTNDIARKIPIDTITANITRSVDALHDLTEVAVLHMSPLSLQHSLSHPDRINFKMDNMLKDRVQILQTNVSVPTSKIVIGDGFTLSDNGAKLYCNVLDQVSLPAKKPKVAPSTAADADDNVMVTELVQVAEGDIKHVIGKGGRVISELQEKNNVSINMGKWSMMLSTGPGDKSKRTYEEVTLSCAAVKGKGPGVKKARRGILKVLSDNSIRSQKH